MSGAAEPLLPADVGWIRAISHHSIGIPWVDKTGEVFHHVMATGWSIYRGKLFGSRFLSDWLTAFGDAGIDLIAASGVRESRRCEDAPPSLVATLVILFTNSFGDM